MREHPLTRRLYLEMGVRVRRRRDALKLTQEDLAGIIGVSRSSVANIERGRHFAPVHLLLALAEALNVDMGDLLPTHGQLETLIEQSRDVPKLVSIGGESSLMTPQVVQLVGEFLTHQPEPLAARRPRRIPPGSPQGAKER